MDYILLYSIKYCIIAVKFININIYKVCRGFICAIDIKRIAVNKKGQLLGTLTDGDIRRGFLKGLNLNSSIKTILFKKPITVKNNDSQEKILK